MKSTAKIKNVIKTVKNNANSSNRLSIHQAVQL